MFNITYQEGRGRRKRLDFEGVLCDIGSDKKCNFIIKSRRVEKHHAKIEFTQGRGCVLTDMGSKSGTWVNNERVPQEITVAEQDEIIVGDVKIWVHPKLAVSTPKNTYEEKSVTITNQLSKPGTPEQTPSNSMADEVDNSEFNEWCNRVHNVLLSQMDLRRKDVHRMSDVDLRRETEPLLEAIIVDLEDEFPASVSIELVRLSVLNEAVGLGPLEKFLEDDTITEIMVNSHEEVFVERGGKLVKSEYNFSSDQAVLSVIERIITPIGRRIDESSPMVDARLKDGSRVNAVIPPLALKGPSLTIRKFSKKRLQFSDLVGFGSVSNEMVEFLRICVENHKNIIVSGGTGSGKTTLLNVLSSFIPSTERIVTVEDAAELKLDQPNLVSLESKPPNLEGKGQIAIRDLVKNTLRMRPDRIVVGECRGGEALDMLQAMNTGHDGSLTTAHANSPRDLISRLEVMVLMAGMDLPVTAIREQIASAVHIVVQQTRFPCGSRKISKITEVVGMESGVVQLQDIFLYERDGYDENGKVKGDFKAGGYIPTFYEELTGAGVALDLSIFKREDAESFI